VREWAWGWRLAGSRTAANRSAGIRRRGCMEGV
jgi:hypothetical protein